MQRVRRTLRSDTIPPRARARSRHLPLTGRPQSMRDGIAPGSWRPSLVGQLPAGIHSLAARQPVLVAVVKRANLRSAILMIIDPLAMWPTKQRLGVSLLQSESPPLIS